MNKTVRITLITIGSLIVAVSLFFVIGFWPGSTKDVEAVANQFQPGDGWKLVDEQVRPPMVICLQADCNEVDKRWKLEKNITTEEFIAVVKNSGWGDMLKPDVECATIAGSTGSFGQTMCEANGYRDGFSVYVGARGNHEDNSAADIVLRIEKER